jgi:septation ring formation regulator EzrA
LKGSIDTLKQDLESYKGNERKIIEVLRESKLKISEYKERIKAKSKKITDVTDSNINLKNKLAQL